MASSLGRMRVRITAMRGWKPFVSKALKSEALNAAAGIGVLLRRSVSLQVVEREDRPSHAREREAPEIRGREPRRVDLENGAGQGLEGGAIVDRGLDHQDLLRGGIDPHEAD